MDNPNSFVGQYLRTINSLKDELISISKCMVADAFFSKESFVTGLNSLGFSLISSFRDDVRLKYLYTGPKTGQRGRPKKFIGDVNLKKLDMSIFETFVSSNIAICSAIVWDLSLKREVKVVIADFNEPDKKAQSRKVFFSTDTLDFAFNMSLSTINIARQFGAQYRTHLSVGDIKVLLHNAAMAERLFSMFGNRPNLKINNTDFKELLFYGVRAAA